MDLMMNGSSLEEILLQLAVQCHGVCLSRSNLEKRGRKKLTRIHLKSNFFELLVHDFPATG